MGDVGVAGRVERLIRDFPVLPGPGRGDVGPIRVWLPISAQAGYYLIFPYLLYIY